MKAKVRRSTEKTEFRIFDSPTRVYVRRPGKSEHLVDLVENECACEDYTFRIAPFVSRGEKPPKGIHCVHLRLAREWFEKQLKTETEENEGLEQI